jgi:DNA processing protein
LACAGLSGDAKVGAAIGRLGGASQLLRTVQAANDVDLMQAGDDRVARALPTPRPVVDAVLRTTERLGLTVVSPQHETWPRGLDALGDSAPLLLWVRGPEILLRRPSREERHATLECATSLADRGWVVASGTAPGVETLALKAARAMGGPTITVAPMGLDRCLPSQDTGSLTVSAEPPSTSMTAPGIRRGRQVLAALTTRMIVVDEARCVNAGLAADAARALGRPVGVAATK